MDELLKVSRTTYKVADFLSWQRQGTLNLRPPFQRGSVWNPKAKSFFIDSIVRGFPVPLIFLQDRTDPQTYEPQRLVVDGQQRLRTVLAYLDPSCLKDAKPTDAFKILRTHNPDLAGQTFKALSDDVQQRILNFEFSVHVLPSTTPNRKLLEIFARMNSTGMKANEQELRNAAFSGSFKQFAYSLAYEQLERWLEWKLFSEQQVARMKEVELTSELAMFFVSGFSGRNQRAIDGAYRRYDDDFPSEQAVRRRFSPLFDILESVLGTGHAIGPSDSKPLPFNTQGWFYPLFAWVHDLVYTKPLAKAPRERAKSLDAKRLREHLSRRATALQSDQFDSDVLKALRGASTDKSSRQTRYDFLRRGWSSGR